MAETDDIVARLLSKKYTREAWDEPYGTYDQPCDAEDFGAEESFVNPAGPDAAAEIERLRTTIAERDAQIERLTELDAQRTVQAIGLMDRATTAERELAVVWDEVRRLSRDLETDERKYAVAQHVEDLKRERDEARKAALEEAAAAFKVYASDQRASIAKGWVRGRGIKDAEVRAETWEDAAKELREAAADPAIRALI